MIGLAAAFFLIGLGASFLTLYRFERQMRLGSRLERAVVGQALRGLLSFGLLSGIGIGLLGISGFVWGRESEPGAAAYAWAMLFASIAVIGWPAILAAAFMARVNALRRMIGDE